MTSIAPTLQSFFTDRLVRQRQVSPRTVAAYRDALRLLLGFVHQRTGIAPERLGWSDLDADAVSAFLNYLEDERGNSTRNVRLTAIRSLFSYAALQHPEHALLIQRVLDIPPKRCDKRNVTSLTAAEVDALLAAPDPRRWEGRRDKAMLALAVQTGLRVSELTGLDCDDVTLGEGASVRCEGKGRKHRAVPLDRSVQDLLGPGSENAPASAANRCSAPGPDGASPATPSPSAWPSMSRLPPQPARPSSTSASTPTSYATVARCPCSRPVSTPQ